MEGGPDVIVLCLPLHCVLDQLNVLMGLAHSSAKWASEALPCPFLLNMTTHHCQPSYFYFFFPQQSHHGKLYQEKKLAARHIKHFLFLYKEKKMTGQY